MNWTYRIMRKNRDGKYFYGVYDTCEIDGKFNWTIEPVSLMASNVDDLKKAINTMYHAFDNPVLDCKTGEVVEKVDEDTYTPCEDYHGAKATEAEAEEFWNSLSYENKLNAFYAVCKKLHKGEIVDKGSYRHVLYRVFGFDKDAYGLGVDCGYITIHNSINQDPVPAS